jgi:hypothetical protein
MCETDCERSCPRLIWLPGGAKVGVLAVVNASVVVEVLGCENDTSASSFPSQRCRVGLYVMPFSSTKWSVGAG